MHPRRLILLLVLAVVLGGLAYLLTTRSERQQAAPDVIGQKAIDGLQVNDIARMVVTTTAGTTTVARADDHWVVVDRYNYPADFDSLKETVIELYELKIGQKPRVNASQYGDLQLLSPKDAAAGSAGEKGTLVELYDDASKALASVIVGKTFSAKAAPEGSAAGFGAMGSGRYIRVDDGEVFLVTEMLSGLTKDVKGWLDDEFIDLSSSDVIDVVLSGTSGVPVRIYREDKNADWQIDGLAENEELNRSGVNGAVGALSYCRFEDVADPARTDAELGFDSAAGYRSRTVDGQVYELKIGGKVDGGDNRYVRATVRYEEPADDDSEETDEAKIAERKAKRKEIADKVEKLNDRISPWTYVLSSWKADSLVKDRADLVDEKEPEEPEEPEEDAGEADEAPATGGEDEPDAEAVDGPAEPAANEAATEEPAADAAD